MLKVPNSNHVSEFVCKHFCGILLVDGKYVHVKGYEKKIPLIWCLDYYSHDILVHQISPSENYQAYLAFFNKLKNLKYPLKTLVCDELDSIYMAARHHYPKVKVQLCTNHYKEGIRRTLRVRTNDEHVHFVKQVECLFRQKNIGQYSSYARKLMKEHSSHLVYQKILSGINKKHELLIRYLIENRVPQTTNLIEVYNSHLEARVRSSKGFNSFKTAEHWINAYVVNRRLSKFTSCSKKFKYLNGNCSLAFTAGYDTPKVSLLKKVGKF